MLFNFLDDMLLAEQLMGPPELEPVEIPPGLAALFEVNRAIDAAAGMAPSAAPEPVPGLAPHQAYPYEDGFGCTDFSVFTPHGPTDIAQEIGGAVNQTAYDAGLALDAWRRDYVPIVYAPPRKLVPEWLAEQRRLLRP